MFVTSRRELVSVLQRAHAGELAAALAYQGHARSLADPEEAAEVLAIALEELDHRKSVSRMLEDLGVRPRASRERVFRGLGLAIGYLCRVSGWLAPMYGAGWLEAGNVGAYEDAAGLALTYGRTDFGLELFRMADVERRHERYFRAKVMESGVGRILPLWAVPIPASVTRRPCSRAGRFPDSSPTSRARPLVSRETAP